MLPPARPVRYDPAVETLAELVATRAADGAGRPALTDDTTGVALGWDAPAARVQARAAALVGAGVRRGDRVAILLPNSLACAEALLAAAVAGAAAVPINGRWTAAEV